MRDEILESQPQDPEEVIKALLGPIPGAKPHCYQKHMTQHMIDGVSRDWIHQVTNVFLIRHPARVIASFAGKHPELGLGDVGVRQQWALIDELKRAGSPVTVVDSDDIRQDPAARLEQLCEALDLAYSPKMLRWPKGGHHDDGIWGHTGMALSGNRPALSAPRAICPRCQRP